MNLAAGDVTTLDSIESFAFSPDGKHLLMRHYAPERHAGARRAGSRRGAGSRGHARRHRRSSATWRPAATRRSATSRDAVWQTKGRLLAIAIAAEDRAGNGVQVFDPGAGTLRVLDSGSARYLGLGWRKDADDLVVLKSKT